MHENRANSRRNLQTCFRCDKQGHFVADCLEEMETSNNYKHWPKMEDKHCSRHEHKHKNKDEWRSRKKVDYGKKKAKVMVGASDVDSSSSYSTSSSSSNGNDDDRSKNKNASKNLSDLSCFVQENGFCGMAHNSSNKKSQKEDSDSGFEDEASGTRNIWLIDSSCSRNMTGDQGWFSSLTLVVSKVVTR
jgi:hypothetical protein